MLADLCFEQRAPPRVRAHLVLESLESGRYCILKCQLFKKRLCRTLWLVYSQASTASFKIATPIQIQAKLATQALWLCRLMKFKSLLSNSVHLRKPITTDDELCPPGSIPYSRADPAPVKSLCASLGGLAMVHASTELCL